MRNPTKITDADGYSLAFVYDAAAVLKTRKATASVPNATSLTPRDPTFEWAPVLSVPSESGNAPANNSTQAGAWSPSQNLGLFANPGPPAYSLSPFGRIK